MNNIHENLEKKEIRDFFSCQFAENESFDDLNQQEKIVYTDIPLDNFIRKTEVDIKYLSNHLKYLKNKKVLLSLLENNNWIVFDVSDFTKKDVELQTWYPFIGTKDEYETFIQKFVQK